MSAPITKILKPSEEIGGLFLCSLKTINNLKTLTNSKIEAIVCATKITPNDYRPYKYFNINPRSLKNPSKKKKAEKIIKILPIENLETSDISRYFFEASKFIHEKRLENLNVAVHCSDGVSRAVAVVVAYFVIYEAKSVDEALEVVKGKFWDADPNFGFLMQLRELERFRMMSFEF